MKIFLPLREDNGGFVSAVQYYRGALPLLTLQNHNEGFEVVAMNSKQVSTMANLEDKVRDKLLSDLDVYWLSRLQRKKGLDLFVKEVHSHGSKIIFDTDDDLTSEHRQLDIENDFLATVKAVDMVTVSTPFLASRMEGHIGYKPTVLPNNLDTSWFAKSSIDSERLSDKVTVGFIGTSSHYDDWKIAEPAVRKLSNTHDVQVLTAGYCPDYLEDIPGVKSLGGVSYPYYPGMMRQFDIVCCVLDEHDIFNHSKSSVKALEAMASARRFSNGKVGGAVPVCTDMKVYRRTVGKRNGVLIDNDDWYPVLKELVEDSALRQRLAIQGHKWVRKNKDINNHYQKWGKLLRRVCD